jgi:hypothetical protein
VYESRLELARLILADFDPLTVGIAAQPFLIEAEVGGKPRRHVPDYLIMDVDQVVTVVNVKPAERLADPAVAAALAWAGEAFKSRGWRSETWSGTHNVTMCNVRFLAGYRRRAFIDQGLAERVRQDCLPGERVEDLEGRLGRTHPGDQVRPAVLHALWRGWLQTDLTLPLGPDTRLRRAGADGISATNGTDDPAWPVDPGRTRRGRTGPDQRDRSPGRPAMRGLGRRAGSPCSRRPSARRIGDLRRPAERSLGISAAR